MTNLKNDYYAYIDKLKAKNADLLSFECPYCAKEILTLAAHDGEVWDSLSTCPHCNNLFIKVTKGKLVDAFVPPFMN